MAWTSPADLRAQVLKLWDKGALLGHTQASPFPLRLKLACPSSTDLATRFADVRLWASALRHNAVHYRIQDRELRHREVGSQTVPDAVWLDTLEAAISLIGKAKEAQRFAALVVTPATFSPRCSRGWPSVLWRR